MDRGTNLGLAELSAVVAGRCYPGERVSGDAVTEQRSDGRYRLSVIDGLGHGPEAAEAANVATQTLAAHPNLEPAAALLACHEAMGHTRGAALMTVQIDLAGNCLTYAGIGNVEGRLHANGSDQRLVSFRGIVGKAMRSVRTFELELPREWVLIIHTDGVSDRFDMPDLPGNDYQAVADQILDERGRATDDATVVIVAPAR